MKKQQVIFSKDIAIKQATYLKNILPMVRGSGLSAEKIKAEYNFLKYVKLLKGFAQRYCVMVVACDTPCGPSFTREMGSLLMNIGLSVNLYGRYRCAYAALIDAGELVFEQIQPDTQNIVEATIDLDGSKVELVSVCFNAPEPQKSKAIIGINGKNYSQNQRGINIVIYDKVTQNVIDSIAFDTFSDSIPGYRPSELSNNIRYFCERHPGVSVICFNNPKFPTESLTSGEQFLVSNNIIWAREIILNNLSKHVFALNQYYDEEGVAEVLSVPNSYHDVHGIRHFEDKHGKYVNIAGGHRVTLGQPENYNRTLYMVGGCTVFGIGADDEHTIASFLQNLFNKNFPECKIKVQNYGYYLCEEDRKSDEQITILNSLPVKQGDIILYWCQEPLEHSFIDLSKEGMLPRSYEMFFDQEHFTPDGNQLIAERLFEGLMREDIFKNERNSVKYPIVTSAKQYGFDENDSNELSEYKKILTDFYNEMFAITIGAVVMNCNPFTLGHRYLIEKALEQCDYLIIFVVQEDKSTFSFDERLHLIDEGTADLKNVAVIPSGRFVLSSLTFSEYFNKSKMQDRVIDTSLDVTVFAQEIAPCLHITKRFAGEEPHDKITQQYNETMRQILPEYGIEFIEIPRKKEGEEIISASQVRALLEKRDFKRIKQLVPETTFRYLLEKNENF